MLLRLACAALLSLSAVMPAAALDRPSGPVVLTVYGNVDAPNRGALDPFHDALLDAGGARFDRAAEFDLDMLSGLGMHEVTTGYDGWPGSFRFEGPLLRDVLQAAGAAGRPATVFALDGYGAQIPAEDMSGHEVILALKRDGEWLGLGGRGPAWVVYPRDGNSALEGTDDTRWVWAVVRIEVE